MTFRSSIFSAAIPLVFVISAALIFGGTFYLSGKYLDHAANAADQCAGKPAGTTHVVTIKDDRATPASTVAPLCDRLQIVNDDNVTRLIAFGPHENHVPYDGIAEQTLTQGQSLTVTLNAAGSFRFHDHIHDEVVGLFRVTN